MLDIKIIRENPDLVIEKLKLRNENPDYIFKIQELDKKRLELILKTESLKEIKNKVSKEIGALKAKKEPAEEKIAEMSKLGEEIKSLDESLRITDEEIQTILYDIPALPADNIPVGKSAEENVQVKISGEKADFGFKVLDHVELGKKHDILDFERGAKISGSGFPLYKGKGATLERALINFMLDTHIANGYREVMTPVLVNRASMEAAEKVPKFEDDMYKTEDDLFAIPTAEVPIINIHRDEILRADESSNKEMEKMLNDACRILEGLKIYYRIIELCTGDIGFSASKCYDIEVWSYAEDKWLEASSVSNCTDFQSRRAKIRYKKVLENGKSKTELVHLLNGSGLATSRLMVAMLEANQTKDGNIIVPEVLRKYTGFDII